MLALVITIWSIVVFFGLLIRRQRRFDSEWRHGSTVVMLWTTVLLAPTALLLWLG